MPLTIHIERLNDFTVYTVTGEVSSDDMLATMESFHKGQVAKNTLWDFTKARLRELTSSAGKEKTALFTKKHARLSEGGKIALVFSPENGFRIAGTYEDLTINEEEGDSMSVFRSVDEAVDWFGPGE